jgi:hypothetical protein
MLGSQVADASTKAEPDDTGGANNAPGCDESKGLSRRIEVEPCRAAFGASDLCIIIHLNSAHPREVYHEPAITDAVAGGIVPTAAHSHLELMHPSEIESNRDIAGTDTTYDHRRMAIHESIEAAACCFVFSIRGEGDRSGQRTPQFIQALIG